MQYVTINSDALTSNRFTLEDPSRKLALAVPSMTAAAVSLRFSQVSGTAPFLPLQRLDGTAGVFTVYSGPGPAFCLLPQAPTRWGLIAVTTGTASQVNTFTILGTTAKW